MRRLRRWVGKDAAGLSAAVVSRLKARWAQEYDAWKRSALGKDRWVYLWADGIYSRAEDEKLLSRSIRNSPLIVAAVAGMDWPLRVRVRKPFADAAGHHFRFKERNPSAFILR